MKAVRFHGKEDVRVEEGAGPIGIGVAAFGELRAGRGMKVLVRAPQA